MYLSSTHGCLDDNRNVQFLRTGKDGACPFQVIGVEGTDTVVTFMCSFTSSAALTNGM